MKKMNIMQFLIENKVYLIQKIRNKRKMVLARTKEEHQVDNQSKTIS